MTESGIPCPTSTTPLSASKWNPETAVNLSTPGRIHDDWVAGGGIAFVVRQIGAYCVEGNDIEQPYPVQQRRCFDDVAAIGSTCGVLECVPNFSGAQIFGDKQVRSKVGAALARASQGVN